MTDRKATFAKRQREMEQKDRAKQREARRAERRANGGSGGPAIDWSAAHRQTSSDDADPAAETDGTIPPTPSASDDSAGGTNRSDT
jgi:hypothetical protein